MKIQCISFRSIFAICCGLALSSPMANASPMISEFLAINDSGATDEDGAFSDWIELHNPTGEAIDLAGYYLTDELSLPTQWQFPAGVSLPAGGYLRVWASGKNRQTAGQPLHTNFSLSGSGEYLGLYAPNGTTVVQAFSPTYPAQSAGVSYGPVTLSASAPGAYFLTPTPGAVNGTPSAEPVVYSVTSRTFAQGAPLNVTLTTPTGEATIRYTTNRSMPIDQAGVAPVFSVDASTDIFTSLAHGLSDRDPVQLHSAASLPGGLGAGLTYFVKVLSPNTFQISEDLGGAVANVTNAGTGQLHVRRHAARLLAPAAGSSFTVAEHRFYPRDEVRLEGTVPAPFTTAASYYINVVSRNVVSLSATPGGPAVSVTSGGSGEILIRRQPSPLYTTPLSISYSQRLRAATFQAGRAPGPLVSHSYMMLDAAAQAFTSNIPVMLLHSFGSGLPSTAATNPEDSKEAVWFTFEPKLEGATMVTRLTNPPDLVTPGYFERRGSSTFGAAKFSMTTGAYNELGKGADVAPLGFASNDDFVLNAHYDFDRSLMHNDLIYRLSNEAGRYAPRTRHVEVFLSTIDDVPASGTTPASGLLNGASTSSDYYGVFSFQDKISRGTNRVNVEKLEPTHNAAPEVQGGYVFKIDRLDLGDVGLSAAGRVFALVQPKEKMQLPAGLPVITPAQTTYLAGKLNSMYSALIGPNFMDPNTGYAAHLDVPAAIDHWWLSILPKSADAFRLSGYWHKPRFGKLAMGPIFDFDRAMGSTDGRDLNPRTWRGDVGDLGTDYFHNNAAIFTPNYFHNLFNDPNYWQATIDRYESLRSTVLSKANVHGIINAWTELLDPGNGANTPAKRNSTKWITFINPLYRAANVNTPGTDGTFRGEAAWLKNWWGKTLSTGVDGRLDFVDGQFTRPPVPSHPPGPVPSGTVVNLSSPTQATTPGTKIFYTTNGTDPRARSTAPETLFTPGAVSTLATILPEISSVRGIVPNANTVGGTALLNFEEWHGTDYNGNGDNGDDFDDSTWFTNPAGTINGIGYDDATAAGAVDFLPYVGLRWNTATVNALTIPAPAKLPVSPIGITNVMRNGTINAVAYGGNQSCFARYRFTLSAADMALINTPGNTLQLQVRVDDGFVAWLNGTELTAGRLNAPAAATVGPKYAFSAAATTTNADGNAILYQSFNVTSQASVLHAGVNVLAIQGLNSGLGSSDFVLQPKLVIGSSPGLQGPAVANFSSAATEYTSSFTITQPTAIFARTLHPLQASDPPTANGGGIGAVPNGSSWSGPTVLYYFPGADVASEAVLRITEVNYHPPAPTPAEVTAGFLNANDFEFIRLTNTSTVPLDLTGAYFSNGLDFTAAPGLQNWLPAGQSVVVVENRAAFISRYGSTFNILGEFQGELDDGGEHIVLKDKTGQTIADFIYGDSSPWPEAADGQKSLLWLGGPVGDAESWGTSLDPGGTGVATYATFASRNFALAAPPATTAPEADPDKDGYSNLLEYAMGTDPNTPQSVDFLAEAQDSTLVVRRRVDDGLDIHYELQASTGLDTWQTYPATSTSPNGDGTETVTLAPPPLGPRVQLRMKVTIPTTP